MKRVVVLVILALSLSMGSALAIDLDTCKQSGYTGGSTYTLTKSLRSSGDCLIVDSQNITIDCNGYAITGDGTGDGITFTDKPYTFVQNCIISNFENGIYINGDDDDETIENVKVIDNILFNNERRGAYIKDGRYYTDDPNFISQNIFYGSEYEGLYIKHSNARHVAPFSYVDQNFMIGNPGHGLKMLNSDAWLVHDNYVVENGERGVYLSTGTFLWELEENLMCKNTGTDLYCTASSELNGTTGNHYDTDVGGADCAGMLSNSEGC